MFGAAKPTFGATTNSAFGQSTNLFGSTSKPQTQTTTNLFGQPSVGLSASNTLFSGTSSNTLSWGAPTMAQGGTSLAFNPPITADILQRGGQSSQVNVKHMCITAMKEYQDKSLEELRLEDYALNRRGQPSTSAGTSLFSTSTVAPAAAKPFQFGTSQIGNTSSIFGQANKPANTLFGGNNLLFGSTSTVAQPVFGQTTQAQTSNFAFGQTNQTTSVFGAKPLFGTGTTATGTQLFGTSQTTTQPGTTGFTFGQAQQQSNTTNLFGQSALSSATKPTIFGTQASTGTGLFGSTSTGLFGTAKPAGTTPLFGATSTGLTGIQPQQQPQSGFAFGTNLGATSGLKPAGTGLFGTTAPTTSATALKPGGLFGLNTNTGTTPAFGFGTGLATNQAPAFGTLGTATSGTGELFGDPNSNLAAKKPFGFGPTLTTTTSGLTNFGFGQPSATPGLFGNTGVGGTPGFGLGTGTATGGIGGTGSLFGQTSTGFSLGQKPLQSSTATPFGAGFGLGGTTGLGTGATSLGGTGFGTGLFGSGSTGLSLGVSTSQPGLGSSFTGFGTINQPGSVAPSLTNNSAEQAAQAIRAQQQVLELVRSMPYGQSSLFRYLNLPTPTTSAEDSKNVSSNSNHGSGISVAGGVATTGTSVIVPAKAVANALAERNKAAGLVVGSSPRSGSALYGRGMSFRRPVHTSWLFQDSNRDKLFSGFYEDESTLASSPTVPSATGIRRTMSMNNNPSTNAQPGLGSFFVRRDEWKRLHLPESMRNSILERSNVISQELSQLAESKLDKTNNNEEIDHDVGSNRLVDSSSGNRIAAGDNRSVSMQRIRSPSPLRSQALGNSPLVTHSLSGDRIRPNLATSSSVASKQSTVSRAPSRTIGLVSGREGASICNDDPNATWTSSNDVGNETSILSPKADKNETSDAENSIDIQPNAAGVKLTKPGYYTLPTLDELANYIDSDGKCLIEDFVVGRRHYGHILYPGITDITNINLDDIVHIRRREVVVYPDDDKKPPVGTGLNRRAEVCLEGIWPADKSTREPIKSLERLSLMHFEDRLERATQRMDAKFIEYRPESGSWVFEVKHFSKYRLDDSDDEDSDMIKDVLPCYPPKSALVAPSFGESKQLVKPLESEKDSNLTTCESTAAPRMTFSNDMEQLDDEPQLFGSQKSRSTFMFDRPLSSPASGKVRSILFSPTSVGNTEQQPQLPIHCFDDNEALEMVNAASGSDRDSGWIISKKRTNAQLNDSVHEPLMNANQAEVTIKMDELIQRDQLSPKPTPEKLFRSSRMPQALQKSEHLSLQKVKQMLVKSDLSLMQWSFPFNRYVIDAGLWHGQYIRPSWGNVRSHDISSSVLIASTQCSPQKAETWPDVNRFSKSVISLQTWPSVIEFMDGDLLNAALATSVRLADPNNHSVDIPKNYCPMWYPSTGLSALESYTQLLKCDVSMSLQNAEQMNKNGESSSRISSFRRIFSLCLALWGRHPQETFAHALAETDGYGRSNPICTNEDKENSSSVSDDDMTPFPNKTDSEPHHLHEHKFIRLLARKQAVSEWIRAQSKEWLQSRLKDYGLFDIAGVSAADNFVGSNLQFQPSKFKIDVVAQSIFACLVSGEPGTACRIAILTSMPALASLIAQCTSGDPLVRRGLQRQMGRWHEMKYDQHIPIEMLKVYCLLAGSRSFSHPHKPTTVPILANLNWIQILGVHLWYLADYSTDLSGVVKMYSSFWHPSSQHYDASISPPFPPTTQELTSKSLLAPKSNILDKFKSKNDSLITKSQPDSFRTWPRDTAYHLLQLHSKQWHRLERTLDSCCVCRTNPETCAIDPSNLLDWALPWHLWRVLHALGYQHFENPETLSRLCWEFATQLEDAGLWEWSVFVLLHEADDVRRNASVKALIGRHVSLVLPNSICHALKRTSNDVQNLDILDLAMDELSVTPPPLLTRAEQFVVEQLGVPVQWIHEAKAILAHHRLTSLNHQNESREWTVITDIKNSKLRSHLFILLEATHWLASGHIEAAESVLTKRLLPDVVLHTDWPSIVSRFPLTSRSQTRASILGQRLVRLLQPFDGLCQSSSAEYCHTALGVYQLYGKVLCLVNQLTQLYTNEHRITAHSDDENNTDNHCVVKSDQLAQILNLLQSELAALTKRLQSFNAQTVLDRVVKAEIATTCVHLMSAFLATNPDEGMMQPTDIESVHPESVNKNPESESQNALNFMHQQLIAMTKLGLPADYRLKELRNLAEVKLSLGVI